jgi:hypothetical protein
MRVLEKRKLTLQMLNRPQKRPKRQHPKIRKCAQSLLMIV